MTSKCFQLSESKKKKKLNRANLHLSPAQNRWVRMHLKTKRCRIFLPQDVFKSSYPASVATQQSSCANAFRLFFFSVFISLFYSHLLLSYFSDFVLTLFLMATMNNTAMSHHPVMPHLCPSNINQGKMGQWGWCQVKLGHPNWFCGTKKSSEDSPGVSRYSL